ncbi:MAG: phosphoribosylanthranilate isomerase [Candidatus Thorarchaeota archaeon]|nr:phosphoribosylanthranilate isomerase [Candidatus Thorarchaeota archaeon]
MTRVQVCGVRTVEDALMCEEEGVDAVGFVLVEGRKRSISPKTAREIGTQLGPFVQRTGIILERSVETIIALASEAEVDVIQTYSQDLKTIEELRDQGFRVVNTVLVTPAEERTSDQVTATLLNELSELCDLVLFEPVVDGAFGGQGLQHDYHRLTQDFLPYCRRFAIAGGLNPNNVGSVLRLQPYAVDVSSGVESEIGKKDRNLVRAFVAECKRR